MRANNTRAHVDPDSRLRAISLRFPIVVVSRLMSRRTRLRSVRNSNDFITRTVMMADVFGRARFVSVSSRPEDMMTVTASAVLQQPGREHRPKDGCVRLT